MIFQEIKSKFSILDDIPESIYTELVTHTHGELISRVQSILHWRQCMLSGRIPEQYEIDWPDPQIKRSVLMRLESLNIVQYCEQQQTLTDSLLKDILESVTSAEDYFSHKPDGFVDKLAQRQKSNKQDSSFQDEEGLADHLQHSKQNQSIENQQQNQPDSNNQLQTENKPRVAEQTSLTENPTHTPEQNNHLAFSPQLDDKWQELADSWHTLSSVYTEFGQLLGSGWDLSQGILAAEGWRDIIRYRTLIKSLPELQQLMATLGRVQTLANEETISLLSQQVFAPIKSQIIVEQETWTDKTPMETGGIVLSDEISRLLPSELALLGHPKLKMLWYAKKAERKLLTYCHCGLMPDPLLADAEVETSSNPSSEKTQQLCGPIIICLDTSASMQGTPETLAKALVLEGLRIAFNEQRACFVYAFGGQNQSLEHELDLTQGGLIKLLEFLQQSFHGGTDVVHPLLSALEKQKKAAWHDADILLISDGRFPKQAHLFKKVERLRKQQGLRLHGLIIGNWKSTVMSQLCNPLHYFNEWHSEIDNPTT